MIRRLVLTGALACGLVAMSFSTAQAASVSPGVWAPKFCDAITHYEQTLQDQSAVLDKSAGDSTNLKKVRSSLVSFFGAMATAANDAKQQVEKAGTPSATNGSKLSQRFVAALDKSVTLFKNAKAKSAALPVSSPAAFSKQAKKVDSDLSKSASGVSSEFGNIRSLDPAGEIQSAMQAAPECASLTSTSS